MTYEPEVFMGTNGRWPDAVRLKNLREDESRRYVPDDGARLTAEQVWKAIYEHSIYATFDGVKYYAEGIATQLIADELNAALGGNREKRLEKLVRIYGEIANYFCERFACCDAEFANCKYCIGLPQGGQCELGWCNDESKALGIEQPDYGGAKCESVNLEELYDRIAELEQAATPGSGECEFVDDSDGEPSPPKCNSCGYDPGIYECAWLDDGTYDYERNYCPNCGKKVKR